MYDVFHFLFITSFEGIIDFLEGHLVHVVKISVNV